VAAQPAGLPKRKRGSGADLRSGHAEDARSH